MGPDIQWKLVEAKCDQLKDAARQARFPFLLSLAWAFIWAVTLYNHDYGYTNVLVQRYEQALLGTDPCSDEKLVRRYHPWLTQPPHGSAKPSDEFCRHLLQAQYEEILKRQVGTWQVEFPGLGAPVTVFDLGVVGGAGALILGLWLMFASRREHHAILSIVHPEEPHAISQWFPSQYTLNATDPSLGPEHLAFAYQAVANRFLFLTSRPAKVLLAVTCFLVALPALVAAWNSGTDIQDIVILLGSEPDKALRMVVGVVMTVLLWVVGANVLRFTVKTSALLNAWYLASRDMWEPIAGGRMERPKFLAAHIDIGAQKAHPAHRDRSP